MKTLTEFSTLTLRKAAAARAAAGGANAGAPAAELDDAMDASDEAADGQVQASAEGAPPEPSTEAAAEATGDSEAATSEAAASEAAASEAVPVTDTPVEQKPDPIVDAVAAALSVQADRAARMIEALDIVGNRLDEVRLVRVFQGEKGPHGSIARGEFHYAIDRVASARRRGGRDDRRGRGGDRGGGGGGRGGDRGGAGGFERRDKPRGLGSLKLGAQKDEPRDDDRPGRGEMPRAGIGWQLTSAPRDFNEGRGRGGPRRGPGGPGGRGPGGPGGRGPGGPGGRGPGGPGGGPGGDRRDRRDRGPRFGGPGSGPGGEPRNEPRLGPDGQSLPPREPRGTRPPREPRPPREAQPPQEPRLGPDGQPLPPRPRRERKPIGPDASGLGPDGKPWDPDRRAKRLAERQAQVNAPEGGHVEAPSPPSDESHGSVAPVTTVGPVGSVEHDNAAEAHKE
jgi:hypothetical protein